MGKRWGKLKSIVVLFGIGRKSSWPRSNPSVMFGKRSSAKYDHVCILSKMNRNGRKHAKAHCRNKWLEQSWCIVRHDHPTYGSWRMGSRCIKMQLQWSTYCESLLLFALYKKVEQLISYWNLNGNSFFYFLWINLLSLSKGTVKLICYLKFICHLRLTRIFFYFSKSPVPYSALIHYLQTYHSSFQIDAKTTILPYVISTGPTLTALLLKIKKKSENLVGGFSLASSISERNPRIRPKKKYQNKMQSQSNFGLP